MLEGAGRLCPSRTVCSIWPLPHTRMSHSTRQLFAPDECLPTHLPSPLSPSCPLDPPANRLQPRMYLGAMTLGLSFMMRSCLPRWVHGGIDANGSLWPCDPSSNKLVVTTLAGWLQWEHGLGACAGACLQGRLAAINPSTCRGVCLLPYNAMQDLVTCVGQPLGIVAADSEEQARAAAAAVVVEYEDLPAILDIEDAIAGKYHACTAAAGCCCHCCLPLPPLPLPPPALLPLRWAFKPASWCMAPDYRPG